MFAATSDDIITKISLDGSDGSIKYKPEGVRTIYYISAIGDNVILITEKGYHGRILEHNIESNKFIERVSDIRLTGNIYVVQAGHHTKYIVEGVF